MLRPRILQIDVPAADVERAVAFWGGALWATPVAGGGPYVHLVGATSVLEVHVHALERGAPRFHLDLEAPDPLHDRAAEVARLEALGARTVAVDHGGFTVLEAPAGLLLCVVDPDAAEPTPLAPHRHGRGQLEAVHLDVPAESTQATVAFWAGALRTGVAATAPAEGTALRSVAPGGALRLVVGAVEHAGVDHAPLGAGAHYRVEVGAADPDAEADRLVALGAHRVATGAARITLADPVGNLLDVVPSHGEDTT